MFELNPALRSLGFVEIYSLALPVVGCGLVTTAHCSCVDPARTLVIPNKLVVGLGTRAQFAVPSVGLIHRQYHEAKAVCSMRKSVLLRAPLFGGVRSLG